MNTKTITLLNRNTLECTVGKPFDVKTATEIHKNAGKVLPIFKNFAHFLLENADRIMSDSKMFLCPIYSQVFSPFFTASRPRLGTFIEWWTQCAEVSCDKDGNPIYYISGNPMTGSHACYSIDKRGDCRIARERDFLNILSSFSSVNKRYLDVKSDGEYFEFEEVLKILCGETYEWRMKVLEYKIKLDSVKSDLLECESERQEVVNRLHKVLHQNREIIFEGLKEQIIDFYTKYSAVEKAYVDACHNHGKFKREKRVKLQKGEMTPEDYDTVMRSSSIEKNTLKKELGELETAFMRKYLSRNPNEINLKMVLDYARHQIKCC